MIAPPTARIAQSFGETEWSANVMDAALAPVIAAAIAGLGFWLKDWALDRDEHKQRQRAIERELSHLTCLKTWLETEALAGDTHRLQEARLEAQKELLGLRRRLQRAFAEQPRPIGPSITNRCLRSAVLLPLGGRKAQFVRLLYYVAVSFSVLTIGILGSATVTTDGILVFSIFTSLILMLPAVALHRLARKLETPASVEEVNGGHVEQSLRNVLVPSRRQPAGVDP